MKIFLNKKEDRFSIAEQFKKSFGSSSLFVSCCQCCCGITGGGFILRF